MRQPRRRLLTSALLLDIGNGFCEPADQLPRDVQRIAEVDLLGGLDRIGSAHGIRSNQVRHDLQSPQNANALLGTGPAQRLIVGHADEAGLHCDEQAEVIAEGELAAFSGRLCQLVELGLDSLQTDPFVILY